jgi:hypothetical protein
MASTAEVVVFKHSTALYPHARYDTSAQTPATLRAYAVRVLQTALEQQRGEKKKQVLRAVMCGVSTPTCASPAAERASTLRGETRCGEVSVAVGDAVQGARIRGRQPGGYRTRDPEE